MFWRLEEYTSGNEPKSRPPSRTAARDAKRPRAPLNAFVPLSPNFSWARGVRLSADRTSGWRKPWVLLLLYM
jgi:hypothetical protein